MQPMTASNGMMAAENRRLQTERERLEREITELSRGMPAEASAIVQRADELLAEHGAKISALKARRDAIDAQFGISAREAEERQQREDEQAKQALVDAMNAAAETYFAATHEAEQCLAAFVSWQNEATAAHTALRRTANVMSRGAKTPTAFSSVEMMTRLGRRIGSALRGVKSPDRAGAVTVEIGPLKLPAEIVSPRVPQPGEEVAVLSWREKEERALAGAVAQMIEHGGR
jgi:hypothetical protein